MAMDPAQLDALEAVLRLGAFDAAALELSVTPSAISQRIRALEDRVGAPLVIRTVPARGTEIGHRLARHAQELQLMDASLSRDLQQSSEAARVQIAVNADSLDTWVIPALAESGLIFDITAEDETATAGLLRDGRVSAAITTQSRPVQGCDCFALGRMRYVSTCSPTFFQKHFAEGVTVSTLSRAPMLDFSGKDQLQRGWLSDVAGKPLSPPTHHLPSTQGFVEAAICGLGWGLNPSPMVAAHLATGALVPILPDRPRHVALFWQVRSLVAPALLPLTRAMRRQATRYLEPPQ